VVSIWRDKEIDDAYVIGADVAEGFDYGDFSSAHVLSAKHNEVVATWHGHIDPDLFGEELAMLGYYYNHAFIGVEANNHGLSTNKALQRLSYPKLYARRRLDGRQAYRKQVDTIGWLTTKTSKPLMIDELARDFRAGLGIYDAATIGEMLTFVRNERGQMAGSPFDDRVISLAIANQMLPFARLNPQVDEPNYYMTFQYFLDKVKDPDPDMYVMGSNHRRH
jgi:hypothetical protein